MVSEITGGVTLGTKWAGKLAGIIGLSCRFGVSTESGFRQTLNHAEGLVENDPIAWVKAGVGFSITMLGAEFSVRLGIDTQDPEGGLIDADLQPNWNVEAEVMTTMIGAGVSGMARLNPLAAGQQLFGPRLPLEPR